MPGTFQPYEGTEPYLFASYSRKDSGTVLPLLEALDRAGYRVWYDEGISAGFVWTETLIEKIERCAVFLPFFSHAFNQSRYCFDETEYAYREDKRIIPLYLEALEKTKLRALYRFLGSRQALRLYEFGGMDAFLERLGREPYFSPCRRPPAPEQPQTRNRNQNGIGTAGFCGDRSGAF